MPTSSELSLPFRLSDQNFVCISHLSHAFYMSLSFQHPWFDHPNNIWWNVQVTKLLIMHSSLASRHFLPFEFKYSPQHPVLKHSQSMFFPYMTDHVSRAYKTCKITNCFWTYPSSGVSRTNKIKNYERQKIKPK
jgi:hypothetical protein